MASRNLTPNCASDPRLLVHRVRVGDSTSYLLPGIVSLTGLDSLFARELEGGCLPRL